MEGREAAQLGFCGEPWRSWAAWEGGGRWADRFTNQETVSHCSLTPLALGGKDHEVLDIHQPAEEGRLPGARLCFPPPTFFSSLALAVSMGSSATEPGAAVLGRQTRVTANNQASDASPRYWERGGGGRDPKGQGSVGLTVGGKGHFMGMLTEAEHKLL